MDIQERLDGGFLSFQVQSSWPRILPISVNTSSQPRETLTQQDERKVQSIQGVTRFFWPRDQPVNTSYHSLATWPFEPGCPLLFPWPGNPINTGVQPLKPPPKQDPKRVPKGVSPRVDKCQRRLTQELLPAGPGFLYIVLKINRPTTCSSRKLARGLH